MNCNRTIALFCLTGILTFSFDGLANLASAGNRPSSTTERGFPTGTREGGGTRSGCAMNHRPLTALIPQSSYAKTTKAFPTLLFYVPSSSQPRVLDFVVRNQNDELVYEQTLTVEQSSGLIHLTFPSSEKAKLKSNQDYHWYLSLVCNANNRSEDITVQGWIRRVDNDVNFANELNQMSPLQQVQQYQEAGIWHDALYNLAQLRCNDPDNQQIMQQWHSILQSEGLDYIAQEQVCQKIEP